MHILIQMITEGLAGKRVGKAPPKASDKAFVASPAEALIKGLGMNG